MTAAACPTKPQCASLHSRSPCLAPSSARRGHLQAFSEVALWLRTDPALDAEAADIADANAKEKAMRLLSRRALRPALLRRAAEGVLRATRLAPHSLIHGAGSLN